MSKVTPFSVVYLDILALVLTLARYALSSPAPPSGRIFNGTEIDPPHKYPFLAAIYDSDRFINGEIHPEVAGVVCGASVVNKHWVVTAAHCCQVNNNTDIPIQFIVTGLHNQSAFSPWSQNLSISHCIVHHLYNLKFYTSGDTSFQVAVAHESWTHLPTSFTFHASQHVLNFIIYDFFGPNYSDVTHDIALIRVDGTIIFSDKVTPMNLPSLGFDVTEDGEIKAKAIGWGLLANRQIPMVPNEVDLPLVTLDTCQRTYGYFETSLKNDSFNESLTVLETSLCAGYGVPPESTCYGDSGSPLLTYNSDKETYTLVGLTSWGEKCGVKGRYSVFSNVAKYINWISSSIRLCMERIINKAKA